MQTTKIKEQRFTTSIALQDYLPLELMHSSLSLNWPGIIVRHYSSKGFSGSFEVPNTPDTLLVLNLSLPSANNTNRQYGFRLPGNTVPGNLSCVPTSTTLATVCNQEAQYLHVHILSELWNKLLTEVLELDSSRVELKAFSWTQDSFIEDILLKLFVELKNEGKGSRLYAESLSHALVIHLCRHYSTYQTEFRNNEESLPGFKLKKVTSYIKEKLAEEITLQDLGALIGFSSFHFARLFKASTGLAPYQYVTKMRLEHSQRLLLETNLPIIQIGFEVGMENPSHFSSFFKQYTGVTPTVYRKSVS